MRMCLNVNEHRYIYRKEGGNANDVGLLYVGRTAMMILTSV